MGTRNQDNHLKCDTAGFRGWRETQFYNGKDEDGKVKTIHGFKNALTDEEHYGDQPPGPTGDLAVARHSSDLYKQNYDQINWEK